MKKSMMFFIALQLFFAGICFSQTENYLIDKKFVNNNTFLIICKGWPKEGLSEPMSLESAKEAALINAQMTAKELFNKIDVIRNGNVKKYEIKDDFVVIHYLIKYKNLKKYYKGK